MVYCQCGKTSVDDEGYYFRCTGEPSLIKKSDNIDDLKDKN